MMAETVRCDRCGSDAAPRPFPSGLGTVVLDGDRVLRLCDLCAEEFGEWIGPIARCN